MAESLPTRSKHAHLAVAVDLVIFMLKAEQLHLLLIERGIQPFQGKMALPGGFIRRDETLLAAAQRELRDETGLTQGYLEQVGAFGQPDRDPRERVVSIAFFAILSSDKLALQAGSDARAVSWHLCGELPPLAFDHREIVEAARLKLSDKINRTTIALEFLPAEFTLTELQRVFEAVRGESIDKRNFRKWSQSLSFIKTTGKLRRSGQHRPAKLYRANSKGLLPAPNLVTDTPRESATSRRIEAAAYRKGYEDALGAMHNAIVQSEQSLLKDLAAR